MFKLVLKDQTIKFPKVLKQYRNLLKRVIEFSKRLYYRKVVRINKTNSKKPWKCLIKILLLIRGPFKKGYFLGLLLIG